MRGYHASVKHVNKCIFVQLVRTYSCMCAHSTSLPITLLQRKSLNGSSPRTKHLGEFAETAGRFSALRSG